MVLCHVEDDETVNAVRVWPKNLCLYLKGLNMMTSMWDGLKES